ncbi:hypothetical protein B9G69_007220 [Bdellovibrio sp. SKB1291214]|uniref:hypothetical protein n=1 Tax=Bdellovibrio sp. SKB1291214 TaxID=1732569 RepID=UPI0020CD63CA|nr:hypothetical protein [Bdellovibrio sp. SKB1291214]UYL10369.1 hypothetical protein B9G69_007220 [Bdellovibrio sp. SKB1291214]
MKILWRQLISLMQGLFLLIAVIFLKACASKQVHEGPLQQAEWDTKAMIRDMKENKTQTVSIDLMAVKNQRVRLDVTAMMGFNVASLVMSPKEIAYAIYPKKEFYYGKNSEKSIERIMGLSLHPMNLANIAFEEPVRGPGWICEQDNLKVLSKCENRQRSIRVEWKDRTPEGQKKVVITAPQLEMQWLFKPPQTEVQFKAETFTLKQPDGFKAIQIN